MTPNEEAQDAGKYIRGMTSQPKLEMSNSDQQSGSKWCVTGEPLFELSFRLAFLNEKMHNCTVYWQWSESWRMLYVFHATWLPSRLQDSVKKGTMDQFSLNRN